MDNNDNLERFLKKIFGQHEEMPPESVWGGIRSGLAASSQSGRYARRTRLRRMAVVAAMLLLLSLLGYQRHYYRGEIARLQEEMICLQAEKCPAVALPVAEKAFPKPSILPPAGQASRPSPAPAVAMPLLQPEKEMIALAASPALPLHLAELELARKPLPALSVKVPLSRKPAPLPRRRWSISRHSGLGYTFYTRKMNTSDLWQSSFFRSVENKTVVKSQNYSTGVSLAYDIGSNWSVETGLQYRRLDSKVVHRPDLTFGDRWDWKGWFGNDSDSQKHDYAYFFDGPSSTMYVSLSAESTEPAEDISNQEELQVEITIEERTEMMSIPLLAGYQIGNRRFTGQLRAGLLANIGLDYDVTVSALNYDNEKFKPYKGNGVFLSYSPLNSISFDFFLSAGLAYDLSASWRFSFMPYFSGSLTKKLDGPFIDPNDYSIGGSAAVSYRF
jgi:hypothetical protein